MEFTDYQKRVAAWLVIACVFVLMLWLLGAVLTPFIVGAVLAYALNPAVTHFEAACRGRMPRWAAVMLVMTVFLLAVTGLVMLIVPVILKEAPIMRQQLPMLVDRGGAWTQQMLNRFGVPFQFNFSSLRDLMLRAMSNGDSSTVGSSVWSSLKIGGSAALSVLGNVMLIPMVLFYLLMDWKRFVFFMFKLVPCKMRGAVEHFAEDADAVLGQYLRGQLIVMLVLALYYSVGLSLFGLDLALPVGIFTGLAVFVPYLGYGTGLLLASLTGLLQMGFASTALMVAVVYGVGQVLESFYLTPRLVGERIGLHPLVVIFALMAFGQLFGFVGVLVALPCSAVLLVAVRRLREQYFRSDLYNHD